MANRFWDSEGKYQEGFLREFSHWIVEVSFRQHTLGCYILFAKERVERLSELSPEAIIELKTVLKTVETALGELPEFKPDRFNYLQLGNGLNHLHIHGIPRYKKERNFAGNIWHDTTWGHPPVWTYTEAPKEVVIAIKDRLLSQLAV